MLGQLLLVSCKSFSNSERANCWSKKKTKKQDTQEVPHYVVFIKVEPVPGRSTFEPQHLLAGPASCWCPISVDKQEYCLVLRKKIFIQCLQNVGKTHQGKRCTQTMSHVPGGRFGRVEVWYNDASLKSLVSKRLKGMDFQTRYYDQKNRFRCTDSLFLMLNVFLPKFFLENQKPICRLHVPSTYFKVEHSSF